MKIYLPNSAKLENIENFISKLDFSTKDELDVSFHQKWVAVHPFVLAAAGALVLDSKIKNIPIKVQNITTSSKNYLKRMGLLEWLDYEKEVKLNEHEAAGRFIPLQQIKTNEELKAFLTDFTPLLHAPPEQAEPIRYVMSEIIRNVLEHANSEVGAIVCAQYYPTTGRVAIGIADCGIGILNAMNKHHNPNSHLEAIRLAMKPGITGTTSKFGGTESNAGAGLFFTRSIAKACQDYFVIFSGSAFFKQYPVDLTKTKTLSLPFDPFAERSKVLNDLPLWQGTIVGIDISPNDKGGFKNLLEFIRNAYHLNTSSLKKELFKKPKFT